MKFKVGDIIKGLTENGYGSQFIFLKYSLLYLVNTLFSFKSVVILVPIGIDNSTPEYRKYAKVMIMDFEVLEDGVDEPYHARDYSQSENVENEVEEPYEDMELPFWGEVCVVSFCTSPNLVFTPTYPVGTVVIMLNTKIPTIIIKEKMIEKWNGALPSTTLGDNIPMLNLK